MYRGVVSIIVAITACGDVTNEQLPDPAAKLNETSFRCRVQPILARQCSFNACHGNAGSALRVYTPGKLRATPPKNDTDVTAPLTDAEQHGNFESAAAFSFGTTPDQNWLILKPLPASAGGFEHKGGAIYTGGSDPQVQTITQWLTGSATCP